MSKVNDNSLIDLHIIKKIHDDGTISINEKPLSIPKSEAKKQNLTVYPYTNNKNNRYLVAFTSENIKQVEEAIKLNNESKKKMREKEIANEKLENLKKFALCVITL